MSEHIETRSPGVQENWPHLELYETAVEAEFAEFLTKHCDAGADPDPGHRKALSIDSPRTLKDL